MRALLQALHALAAKRGDGLLPELLPPMSEVSKPDSENPAPLEKEEPKERSALGAGER